MASRRGDSDPGLDALYFGESVVGGGVESDPGDACGGGGKMGR